MISYAGKRAEFQMRQVTLGTPGRVLKEDPQFHAKTLCPHGLKIPFDSTPQT
jgi:hypothetical protein